MPLKIYRFYLTLPLYDLVLPKTRQKNNMRMMEPGSDENTFEALFRFRGGTAEAKEEFTFLRAMMRMH